MTRWLWERSFPSFGSGGELRQICGITEDITGYKRNEEALFEAHQELEERVARCTAELAEHSELIKLLVESTPGAIYGIDAEGNCTFCNKMLTSLVGALRELPSLPHIYDELRLALQRPNTTIEEMAQIVEQDVAIRAKVLQLEVIS